MKEKPRIIVNSCRPFAIWSLSCFYMEVYSDGYNYYTPNGKLRFSRLFADLEGWSLSDIEKKIERGVFIEYTGEKAQAFLAEQVLRR